MDVSVIATMMFWVFSYSDALIQCHFLLIIFFAFIGIESDVVFLKFFLDLEERCRCENGPRKDMDILRF